jgi:glyoxylase-like metal-dependent hydrolase (beta-lactamase superfamily II)
MLARKEAADIVTPFPDPPVPGAVVEVVPGILWTRFFLPFRLNHVNVYLLRDTHGWIAIDTGIGLDDSKAAWSALLAGPLRGEKLSGVVVTHFHPDHVGMAGWLTERFGAPLYMPRTEYLTSLSISHRAFAANRKFYEKHGLPPDATDRVVGHGHGYLLLVTGLPTQYLRIANGDTLTLGGRRFTIITGGGHAPEQAMLYRADDNILFSADQVMMKISPNISVQAMEPEADPLCAYRLSLAALRADLPEDALVLPGHHLPFRGLHTRIGELLHHHDERCALIAEACRKAPRSATELVPIVFDRALDAHQMSFAFSEVVAHVNYMRGRGELVQFVDVDGVLRTRVG